LKGYDLARKWRFQKQVEEVWSRSAADSAELPWSKKMRETGDRRPKLFEGFHRRRKSCEETDRRSLNTVRLKINRTPSWTSGLRAFEYIGA
jgi:hypothetical protein